MNDIELKIQIQEIKIQLVNIMGVLSILTQAIGKVSLTQNILSAKQGERLRDDLEEIQQYLTKLKGEFGK